MIKQEEIREGIKDILERYGVRSLSNKHDDWDFNREEFTQKLLEYLHSQGCVIRVDRKLPLPSFENSTIGVEMFQLQLDTQKEMLKAGYVAVETLIKEEAKV